MAFAASRQRLSDIRTAYERAYEASHTFSTEVDSLQVNLQSAEQVDEDINEQIVGVLQSGRALMLAHMPLMFLVDHDAIQRAFDDQITAISNVGKHASKLADNRDASTDDVTSIAEALPVASARFDKASKQLNHALLDEWYRRNSSWNLRRWLSR
jgi:hypothetical protein